MYVESTCGNGNPIYVWASCCIVFVLEVWNHAEIRGWDRGITCDGAVEPEYEWHWFHFSHALHTEHCGQQHSLVLYWLCTYLVRVNEICCYFSWLLLCDRACPVQLPAFFLSRVLLLGFGMLLTSKRNAIAALLWCAWVLPRTGKISHDQSRFRQTFTRCFFTRHNPHSSTSRYVYITDFVHDETYFKARA